MSDIPSANQKIQIEPTQYRAPVSESLAQTMGGSINYALDQVAANASAISTETTNRINADNAIKAQSVVRRRFVVGGATLLFDSAAFFTGSALMETQSFTIATDSAANNDWVLLQIRVEANETSRAAAYLNVRISTDNNYGTQELVNFTESAGKNFGTVLRTASYSNPITITVRQYADPGVPGLSQRWEFDVTASWQVIQTDALVGP